MGAGAFALLLSLEIRGFGGAREGEVGERG